jgi:hypothetical protein
MLTMLSLFELYPSVLVAEVTQPETDKLTVPTDISPTTIVPHRMNPVDYCATFETLCH